MLLPCVTTPATTMTYHRCVRHCFHCLYCCFLRLYSTSAVAAATDIICRFQHYDCIYHPLLPLPQLLLTLRLPLLLLSYSTCFLLSPLLLLIYFFHSLASILTLTLTTAAATVAVTATASSTIATLFHCCCRCRCYYCLR